MLYYFRHALAVNVESVLSKWRSATFFSGLIKLFFGLVLSLKLQIELSQIHRSRNGVSFLKFGVSHWRGEKLLEPTRSETRFARRFASRLTPREWYQDFDLIPWLQKHAILGQGFFNGPLYYFLVRFFQKIFWNWTDFFLASVIVWNRKNPH